MTTSSGKYVGVDVSKDRLDVALLGDAGMWQVENRPGGIADLVQQMQAIDPDLIVVEARVATIAAWQRHCFWQGCLWRW